VRGFHPSHMFRPRGLSPPRRLAPRATTIRRWVAVADLPLASQARGLIRSARPRPRRGLDSRASRSGLVASRFPPGVHRVSHPRSTRRPVSSEDATGAGQCASRCFTATCRSDRLPAPWRDFSGPTSSAGGSLTRCDRLLSERAIRGPCLVRR
jgi:hypothetical protein